ncbi:MAG: hypothetical protein V3T65_00275 [Acidobacteriota bacterium]
MRKITNQAMVSARISSQVILFLVPLLVLGTVGSALYLQAADTPVELTLPQFRAQVREQTPPAKQAESNKRAGVVFLRLVAAQGKVAAARQSLDRLSGWHEAAQARLEAQSAPPLEVEILHFSEARAAARAAQFQTERRRALQQANLVLGKSPDTPLVALTQAISVTALDNRSEQSGIPLISGEPSGAQAEVTRTQEEWEELVSRKAQFENELLPQGRDLLAKMYQSYLLGGTSLSALLRQESEVYQTELQYRMLLVEAEKMLATIQS